MNLAIKAYLGTLGLCGWYYHKSESYGYRNTEPETGLQVLSMIPVLSLFIVPIVSPALFGYGLACAHDKLLYRMRPKFYQKKIDDYENTLPKYEYSGGGSNWQSPNYLF